MSDIILDIRTEKEYCTGHICNSINIVTPLPPLSGDNMNKLVNRLRRFIIRNRIGTGDVIYVYCKKGIRSRIATDILRQLGMKKVVNLGGIKEDSLRKYIKRNGLMCYC